MRYSIIWTYAANFPAKPITVEANSPEEACAVLDVFSDDFRRKATIYVFPEHAPVVFSGWHEGTYKRVKALPKLDPKASYAGHVRSGENWTQFCVTSGSEAMGMLQRSTDPECLRFEKL